jgi:hypothetical protein
MRSARSKAEPPPRCVLVHDGLRIMASGLPALAAFLAGNGVPTRVWSLHAERAAGIRRDLATELADVGLLGISVQWFYQLPAALRLAQAARAAGYGGFVVLGGFTASLFARELVGRQRTIDGVIRGDGEEPLLALARELERAVPRLQRVPNLVWRGPRGGLRVQRLSYTGDQAAVNQLDFGRLDTIEHLDAYLAASAWGAITDGSPRLSPAFAQTHYLGAGRGCSVDCATCGGGRRAHRRHSGRRGVVFRDPGRLVDDAVAATQLGCSSLHACFDPAPNGRHWHRFMDAVEERGLRTSMLFESFALPDEGFLTRFSQVFEQGVVVLSPETADEELRARNRGFPYSNESLDRTLALIGRRGLRAQVFLGYLVPGEDVRGLHRTRRWARRLAERHGEYTDLLHLPYSTDPGSPLAADPDRWGMCVQVGDAASYLRALDRRAPWQDNLLAHRPVEGSADHWRAVTLGVELELSCRRQLPALASEIDERLGRGRDRYYQRLAEILLGSTAGGRLRREQLAAVVRTHWGADG